MDVTAQPLLGDDLLHVRILQMESIIIDRGWDAADVCSSYWRFYWNERDGAELSSTDGRHPVKAGLVHLVPAWVRFSCHNRHPIRHLYVHFDVVGLPGTAVREHFPRPLAVTLDAGAVHACRQLDMILSNPHQASVDLLCRVKSVVYAGLAPAFAGLSTAATSRCLDLLGGDHPVVPALRYIEDHLPEPLPNALLARECRLAEDHFIRRFRQHLGQTPAQYVIERRIAAAAQRLVFSRDPIEAVAESYGFPNRFYFTRVFTRRMGQSPAAYRHQRRV